VLVGTIAWNDLYHELIGFAIADVGRNSLVFRGWYVGETLKQRVGFRV
jgi:hypothetical protein